MDKHLIKQCIRGNRKAQQELYNEHASAWYTICLRYMKNRNDANDALQNALVKIYSKLDSFDPAYGSFGAWTARIVVNESLMLLRKNTNLRSFHVFDEDYLEGISDEDTPIDVLSAEELVNMIQKLPDGYRVIFNMNVIEGYTHREIAEKLNISEGTSKSQLFKAKKFLKNQLEVII